MERDMSSLFSFSNQLDYGVAIENLRSKNFSFVQTYP
jgi:hypothetical protein